MNSMVILHSYVTKSTRGYVEDISKKYVEDLKDIIPMGFSKYIYISDISMKIWGVRATLGFNATCHGHP